MKVKMSEEHRQELINNKFLVSAYNEFAEAYEEGNHVAFLDANPEFVQMLMHQASKVEVVDE